jgi:hypothetical protein
MWNSRARLQRAHERRIANSARAFAEAIDAGGTHPDTQFNWARIGHAGLYYALFQCRFDALTCGDPVVGTGVDPVTSRFSVLTVRSMAHRTPRKHGGPNCTRAR